MQRYAADGGRTVTARLCVAVLVAVLVAGCGADSAPAEPSDASIPRPRDLAAAECTLTTFGATPDGECRADWVCRAAGVRSLACSSPDAGNAVCICGGDGGAVVVADRPASCADVETVTAFARARCGWSDL